VPEERAEALVAARGVLRGRREGGGVEVGERAFDDRLAHVRLLFSGR
jgi:hypothetical protein